MLNQHANIGFVFHLEKELPNIRLELLRNRSEQRWRRLHSELGSRVRTAERNTDRTGSLTAAAERNLEAASRTVRQKHERTQSRGWGMSL